MIKTTTLRDEVRTLLANRPRDVTYADIAKEIDVSVAWMTSFANGKIDNPGVNSIEALKNYLTKAASKKASL